MAVTTPTPVSQIITVPGEAIVVQLRNIPGAPQDVILHITRNGVREEKFSILELQSILGKVQSLLGSARAQSLASIPPSK